MLDAVEEGLVESLARPGGNITGLTLLSHSISQVNSYKCSKKRVRKLSVSRLFTDRPIRHSQIEVKEILPVAARSLGLTIQPWEVRGVDDFDRVFVTMGKQRSDGLYVTTEPAR